MVLSYYYWIYVHIFFVSIVFSWKKNPSNPVSRDNWVWWIDSSSPYVVDFDGITPDVLLWKHNNL